jgi:hypothetical protein
MPEFENIGLLEVRTSNLGGGVADSVTVRVQSGIVVAPESRSDLAGSLMPGESYYSYFIVEKESNPRVTAQGINTTLATSEAIDVPISWLTLVFMSAGIAIIAYRKCWN